MAVVYILRSGHDNLFKVGRGTDLGQRTKQLATGNPHPLTLVASIETEYAIECEKYLHHRMRSKRSRRSNATEFFELNPSELTELIRDARDYADNVLPQKHEAKRLENQESEDRILRPEHAQWETYRRLLEVREAADVLRYERERLEYDLKLVIGRAAVLEGIATWRTQAAHKFDEAAFKAAEPRLHEAFAREYRSRPFRLS